MRTILLVAFLSFFAIALVTCRKPDPDPEPCECGEVNTVDELREWAYFKAGTYWIYEEETTGARDTFTVVNSHDFITPDGYVQFDYETTRSSDGYFYWFWFNESWSVDDCNNGCCSCRRLWCSKYISGDFDGEDFLLTFPTFTGSYAYQLTFDGKVEVEGYYSSFSVQGLEFQNVVVQRNDDCVMEQGPGVYDYYRTRIFFAKSIGIIRKEISESNRIWNLVEYNIVP